MKLRKTTRRKGIHQLPVKVSTPKIKKIAIATIGGPIKMPKIKKLKFQGYSF